MGSVNVMRDPQFEEQKRIAGDIVGFLEKEKCTVSEAKKILRHVEYRIDYETTVQSKK